MYQILHSFYFLFYDICRFRKGPQDLPYSINLLRFSLLAYITLQTAVNLFNGSPLSAILATAVDVSLMFLLVTSLLYVTDKRTRTAQTLTALLGTGTLISLFALPLWAWINLARAADTDFSLAALLLLGLGGWSLAITAHIFRHALSTQFSVGLMVAIMFSLVFFVAAFSLFPPAAQGG
jgi:hypothetical protein